MVVVHPLPVDNEEEISKVEVGESIEKELQKMCSKNEDVTSDSKDANIPPMLKEDLKMSENDCSTNLLKGRSVRPAKRKQVSEKQNFKRPRGLLKLRSKTIRIMK